MKKSRAADISDRKLKIKIRDSTARRRPSQYGLFQWADGTEAVVWKEDVELWLNMKHNESIMKQYETVEQCTMHRYELGHVWLNQFSSFINNICQAQEWSVMVWAFATS